MLHAADIARRRGDVATATAHLRAILDLTPDHPIALNALGMMALGKNDRDAAAFFERATAADPGAAPLWANLATAHRALGNDEGERVALTRALDIDQTELMANIRLAELLDRLGEEDAAIFRWTGVAAIIAALPDRTSALDQLLERAQRRVGDHAATLASELSQTLDPERLKSRDQPGALRRFDTCLDSILGRRRIYPNAPHGLNFPFLPADEFFDRVHFPWLGQVEAATSDIQAELGALLATRSNAFAPYVSMLAGTPQNIWSPLDRSDAWSALYLWRYGVKNDDMCAQCPKTAALLESLPRADLPSRGPTAFFSMLKPRTRLPAHTGVTNIRSIVHVPLMVPDGCGFRVGGETRPWSIGEAFVFDDTIEHEAWNDSDLPRVVLIFDVWNPHLTATEQSLLRTLFTTLGPRLAATANVID